MNENKPRKYNGVKIFFKLARARDNSTDAMFVISNGSLAVDSVTTDSFLFTRGSLKDS